MINPDVTVVVIAYNDVANIGAAIRSVLNQTLRNLEVVVVDDASSDGTAAVAEEYARRDERVRVVRLPTNSGGCSVPRNTGMGHARAPYVMFLDSNDTYERHACKNLLLEAERQDAEVVAGRCVRVLLAEDGEEEVWFEHLYDDRAVFAGVRENPELFFDPLSTNKLYRLDFLRDHGIEFPVGVHYEDSLFSTKVYAQVQRLAVIPNVVYYWRIAADEDAPSITQRRFEFENFRDRVAVHRMMDDYLAEVGLDQLKPHKDLKFVRHDLRLYLNDLPARDEEYQRRFVQLAGEYLGTVRQETIDRLEPVERICVAMLRRGDIAETLTTVDFLRHGFKISARLVERDGRIYWDDRYLDSPEDRAVMDVTSMGLHRVTFDRRHLFHEVQQLQVDGDDLRLTGRTLNQLGVFGDEPLRMCVVTRARRRKWDGEFAVRVLSRDAEELRWETTVPLDEVVGESVDRGVEQWDLRMLVVRADGRNRNPISVDPSLVPETPLPVRARFAGLAPAPVELFVSVKGNLSLRQAEDPAALARVARVHALSRRAAHGVRWRMTKKLNPPDKSRAYRLFQKLPVKRGLVVFESHLGKQYSDSPRYVFEALLQARPDLRPVWSFAKQARIRDLPEGTETVQRGSWRYHYLLARAEFWVDNQGFPRSVTKRRGQTYVQTWHGTPLKKMGFDEPRLAALGPAARRAHAAMIERWDHLVVPSQYFVDTFVRSYDYRGNLLRVGYPRNDPLVTTAADPDAVRRLKLALGLPTDRRIVLYAPTFREQSRRRRSDRELKLPFDLREMSRNLGEDTFVLVRAHYLNRFRLTKKYLSFVKDVTNHPDMTELLVVADVLVTDYSSSMFDFANTGRPMLFYTYDYDNYVRSERGTYFDLADEAPGPLMATTEELVEALQDLEAVQTKYADAYARWQAKYCEYDDGHAAESVVRAVFADRRGGRR